ncbi:MAG: GNAT family N-acetyltransferase [Bacteroidota bacterium]
MSKAPAVRWTKHRFDELSPHLLYEIIHLRNQVFVVEQECIFQDADHQDQAAIHLCGFSAAGQLLAYARILPRGTVYPTNPSIGRVVVDKSARGGGIGVALVRKAISECRQNFGAKPILASAQTYLLDFYRHIGFEIVGEEYLEDGIPHRKVMFE